MLRCLPPGLPRIFGSPYPMQVVDAGSHYLMVFMQDNTPRRIWMDGRTPPAEQPLTSMGFSTGKWEGRTLVIETTMLAAGLARRLGLSDERRRRHAHRRALDARGRRPDDGTHA